MNIGGNKITRCDELEVTLTNNDHDDVEDNDKDEEDDSRDTTFSYATVHLEHRKSEIIGL